jgi:phosphate uptake regulator
MDDERKIVKSGLFSYTISLPKEWVMQHKLGKGSKVHLAEHQGALILVAEKTKNNTREKTEHTLNVDEAPLNTILRDITAAYLTNTASIRLIGHNLKKNIADYKNAISTFPGLEVIEETGDYILIRDFINIEEIIAPDLIRRADNIIRSMFLDTFDCLKNNDAALAEAIRLRDKEVNRLAFMVYKCLNHINEYPQEVRNHGIENQFCLSHLWELNGYLEKIGDEVKRFAVLIPKTKISSREKEEIEVLLREVEEFYIEIMSALYKGSLAKSDSAANNRHKLKSRCDKYMAESKSMLAASMISKLSYMISFINSISRLIRYVSFEHHMAVKGQVISSNTKNLQ